jgi:hypothetical protein
MGQRNLKNKINHDPSKINRNLHKKTYRAFEIEHFSSLSDRGI